MSEAGIVLLAIGGFCVFFPMMWLSITGLLASVSGWATLAQTLAWTGPLPSRTTSHVTAMLRVVSYRGVLTLASDADALYLAIMPLFRFLHPPLRIPWGQIRVSDGPFGTVAVDLAGVTTLRLARRTWESLEIA